MKIKCYNCGPIEMIHCPICERILKQDEQPYNQLIEKIHEKIEQLKDGRLMTHQPLEFTEEILKSLLEDNSNEQE